ncbi:MAG: hypothetical protein H0T79_20730 [Deltaproteobacteria bacterium]|nr:hypothetical protein [Deltaproteobacteria bacterium]
MSIHPCDLVAERVALGEPLDTLAEHAATCVPCSALVATAGRLGQTRHPVDPGLGFAARMTVAAQQRIGIRRRRRIAGGVGLSVAALGIGMVMVTRTPDVGPPAPSPVVKLTTDPVEEPAPDPTSNDDLRALVRFADVDHSASISARWGRIQKPLKPYRALVKGHR